VPRSPAFDAVGGVVAKLGEVAADAARAVVRWLARLVPEAVGRYAADLAKRYAKAELERKKWTIIFRFMMKPGRNRAAVHSTSTGDSVPWRALGAVLLGCVVIHAVY